MQQHSRVILRWGHLRLRCSGGCWVNLHNAALPLDSPNICSMVVSVILSIIVYVCLFISTSVYLLFYCNICHSIYHSVCLSLYLSFTIIHPSIVLCIVLSIVLSIYLPSTYLPIIYLFLCLSASLSIHLIHYISFIHLAVAFIPILSCNSTFCLLPPPIKHSQFNSERSTTLTYT